MKVRILHHDNCFDGACSAAVFTRFFLEKIDPLAEICYTGLTHKSEKQFNESLFDGDQNVIVDFKYCPSPRLTWWFDHHKSAFLTKEDEDHFRWDRSGKKFVNPDFKSCTKLIATVLAEHFAFNSNGLCDLVYWADIIDGAQYPDAKTAVEMQEPAMKLTLLIESNRDPHLIPQLIRDFSKRPLVDMAAQYCTGEHYAQILAKHQLAIEVIGKRAQLRDGVVYFDLSDTGIEGYNKFIPYYLHPECVYTVSVLSTPQRAKVSVGSNPWNQARRRHNLAEICERYGGGGHAQVAAISFPTCDLDSAKKAASQIVEELQES
ncbi:MAG: phosphoesterase [Acidobacteriia bacterium]|nr:phosphoesterase [Terriglobia bacterium]